MARDKETREYEAYLAYMRRYNKAYRRAHPDKCKLWRDNWARKRAAQLQAEAEAEGGAESVGRD